MNAMGNSRLHKRLYFKFQSVLSAQMSTIVEAFPETPWVFLYRHPYEILASYLPQKRHGLVHMCT